MGLFTCWCGKKILVGEREFATQQNKRISEHPNQHREEEQNAKMQAQKEQDLKNQEWLKREEVI